MRGVRSGAFLTKTRRVLAYRTHFSSSSRLPSGLAFRPRNFATYSHPHHPVIGINRHRGACRPCLLPPEHFFKYLPSLPPCLLLLFSSSFHRQQPSITIDNHRHFDILAIFDISDISDPRSLSIGRPTSEINKLSIPRASKMFSRNVSKSQTESFSRKRSSTKGKSSFREHAGVSKHRQERSARKPPGEEAAATGK